MAVRTILGRTYARAWLLVLGASLVLLAIAGLVVPHVLGVHLEGGELWVHWVAGTAALVFALAVRKDATVAPLAAAFGIAFLALGAFGFAVPSIGGWHVGPVDNVLHLATGAVSLGAWSASREASPEVHGRPTM